MHRPRCSSSMVGQLPSVHSRLLLSANNVVLDILLAVKIAKYILVDYD